MDAASSACFWLPLIFYSAIGIVLHFNHGFYRDGGLAVILLGWIGTVVAGVRFKAAKPGARLELVLWGILSLFCFVTLRNDLLEVADPRLSACLGGSLILACIGLGRTFLFFHREHARAAR